MQADCTCYNINSYVTGYVRRLQTKICITPLTFLAEKRYTYQVEMTWACSSVGSASVSLLCPTELWAFKWGVCRLVAQPSHAPKYGPIAQLGERSVRIREVKGSNPSRSIKNKTSCRISAGRFSSSFPFQRTVLEHHRTPYHHLQQRLQR